MSLLPITDRLLLEAGGWKALKEARALHDTGRVISAEYNPPVLRGLVRDAGREYRAGMVIRSGTDIDNLCTCRESRQSGILCAHSLALGLAVIRRNTAPDRRPPRPDTTAPAAPRSPASAIPAPAAVTTIPDVFISLDGTFNQLVASLDFRYPTETPAGARNPVFEQTARDRLARWGFQPSAGKFVLKTQPRILDFLAEGWPGLERDWNGGTGEQFRHISHQLVRVEPTVDIQSWGTDWFTLSSGLRTTDGTLLDPVEADRLLRMGGAHLRLPDGRIALIRKQAALEWRDALAEADPRQISPGVFRLESVQASALAETVAALGAATGDRWARWLHEAGGLQSAALPSLGSLEKVLRPYQKEGVRWMFTLASNRLGGILADDMGLGKTLQTLATLRALGGKALVVCPSSLVRNWENEAHKFTPDLRVLVIDGGARKSLFERIAGSDLVITSYALFRRDSERYRATTFRAAVLDEANHIKNPDTQNARTASSIRADARFVLTGTPIENSVRDLWSILEFAVPGYLGSRKDFAERYEKPIREGGDAASGVHARLARRLKPLLLRRMKSEVAPDLPERIENTLLADLTPEQEAVYRTVLEQSRAKSDEATRTAGKGQARMILLAALTRLRQTCCDLRLLDPGTGPAGASGKLPLLEELLQEAIDGGHRVLVFSQFVRMLTLLRARLAERDIAYAYLDGDTKNRQDVVDRYQNTPEIPVFLISLRAGGTGLNLTAADTVIHFDPWWNPSVEAQATDRAHRIGQTNTVTSYRLITRGTVEEKILDLQNKKRAQTEAILRSGGTFDDALTMEDLRSLLE